MPMNRPAATAGRASPVDGRLRVAAQPDPLKTAASRSGRRRTTEAAWSIGRSRKAAGPAPTAADTVKVHYRGTLPDGTEFDSSIKRGAAGRISARPGHQVLDRRRTDDEGRRQGKLTCPAAIAYGEARHAGGPIPPNATLTFEVELLGISGRSPALPGTPADRSGHG